jgi:proline dehydrogenase
MITDVSFDNVEIAFTHKTDKDLKRSKYLFLALGFPIFIQILSRLTAILIRSDLKLINWFVKKTIFRQFVGGEHLQDTDYIADRLGKYQVDLILDYGVEAKDDELEFEKVTEEFIKAIEFAGKHKNIPFVSIKVTAIASKKLLKQLNDAPRLRSGIHDHEEQQDKWNEVEDRLYRICEAAAENKVGVLIDAEESWFQDPIDRVAIKLMEDFNKEEAIVYNTLQLYRQDRLSFLKLSYNIAKQRGFILGIKLVRGAYLEKERIRALQYGYVSTIQESKALTDKDFNEAIIFCLNNINQIATIIASHNEESNKLAVRLMFEKQIEKNNPHIHFSQL